MRRTLIFHDRQGRFVGKAQVRELGSGRGNKHFNPRRPEGPVCGQPLVVRHGRVVESCPELFAPVCPNRRCPGHRIPKQIIRNERDGFDARRYSMR